MSKLQQLAYFGYMRVLFQGISIWPYSYTADASAIELWDVQLLST